MVQTVEFFVVVVGILVGFDVVVVVASVVGKYVVTWTGCWCPGYV